MSKTEQALVSLAIRIAVIAGLAILDFLSKNIANIGLPDPTITVPIIGLIVSELDTWLVNYEGELPATTPLA